MKKVFLPICGLLPFVALAQHQKPNVILLVADDLGYGDLSCYGATRVQTPTVDSLAANGVQFTNMQNPMRYPVLWICSRRSLRRISMHR